MKIYLVKVRLKSMAKNMCPQLRNCSLPAPIRNDRQKANRCEFFSVGHRGEDQSYSLKFEKSRQGSGVLLAGFVCLGAGLYKLWRRHSKLKQQLNETRIQLAASDSQIEELSNQLKLTKEELNLKHLDLLALATALEEKTIELSKEKVALEVARGELGLTRSKIGIIERELNITKR